MSCHRVSITFDQFWENSEPHAYLTLPINLALVSPKLVTNTGTATIVFILCTSRSRDKWLSISKPQTEHCNGLRVNRVLQTRDKSSGGSLQEEGWRSSGEDAFRSNQLLLWQVKSIIRERGRGTFTKLRWNRNTYAIYRNTYEFES